MFPANFDRYIEVFGGGGWVLFGKPPDDRCMEVYNDYNSNLANLFYCVKNRTGAFLKELGFLPLNSRDEFTVIRKFIEKQEPDTRFLIEELELAEKYLLPPDYEEEPKKPFVLPEANQTMHRAFAYLIKTRCVDPKVVSVFAGKHMIYEDVKYHNVVFVGFDSDGIPRHAHKSGTCQKGQPFKGNVEGCDPRYSFRWIGKSNTVYVFEAPIDMLSFISMYQKGWMDHSYVALCGVAEHALMQLLNDAPHISQIALCLDHDKAGIQARERIKKNLSERGYHMVFSLFSNLKDWNEDLQELKKPPPEYMNRQQTVIQMM